MLLQKVDISDDPRHSIKHSEWGRGGVGGWGGGGGGGGEGKRYSSTVAIPDIAM